MNRIGILPPDVASKIAAGEVITRPASVIKELVENALDAGARTISVEIAEGGCRQIRVTDDGCGMWPEEAPLSLLRHATSKLQDDGDLLRLKTMGFRGEALPSIAAVSRLEICTRSPELDLGCRLLVDGGILQENLPWAGPAGTQVTVTDLFYNTPARRKFLRSHAAEQGQILELMRHLALGYPEIHFLVQAQGKTLLQTPAHADLRERLAALLGPEWAEKMLPLDLPGHGLRVKGLVSSPDHNLATSKYQFLLVNRRIVSDKLLAGAMRQGYQGLLPRGRHPVFIMHLEAAPEQVDINVHPAKAEVRFKESGRVYAQVLQAVRQALEPAQLPGRQEFAAQWQASPANSASPGPLPVHQVQEPLAELFSSLPPLPAGITPVGPRSAPASDTRPPETAWRFAELDVLGQLQSTYILAQAPEGLLIIDQHAAHERVLFELLTNTPKIRPLGRPCSSLCRWNWTRWPRPGSKNTCPNSAAAGLELEPFGGTTYLVRRVPACLADQDLAALVPEMVAELAPWQHGQDNDQVRRRLHLTMACRGAIKAGQRLSLEEMHHLLVQLDSLAVSSHCPHGRPLWRLLSLPEIRQNFRRPRH